MSSPAGNKKAVMSGMRPTGRLHLGHYFGVLKNWLTLQDQYDCYFEIADWHALTTRFDKTDDLRTNIDEMVLDWLASGVDPGKATLYVQSDVPEIAELHVLLSMITPNAWVAGDPTLKDMVKMLSEDLTYGLLGYPVLQTVDIVIMKGELVPVGKDQLAHLEISRDIVRRFNHLYSTEILPEPKPLLTEVPMLRGLDGNKMGKSANNAIFLADTEEETWQKLRTAITDPARIKKEDPGDPEACIAIYPLYEIFADAHARMLAADECRRAARGCVDCKKILNAFVVDYLKPIRARRAELAGDMGAVREILKTGAARARERASRTLSEVKKAMQLMSS